MSSLLSLHNRIFFIVLFLLVLGQILIFSATGIMGVKLHGSEFYYVMRQGACALIGIGLMLLLSHVRYQWWAKLAITLVVLQIGLLVLTLFSPLGHTAQGASRWLNLGGFRFQPSELSKISFIVFAAYFLARRHVQKLPRGQWILMGVLTLSLLLLTLKQPDLGSTILLSTVLLALFFLAGARPFYIVAGLGGAAGIFTLLMLSSDYRKRRLLAFLNPWADPQGNGFQAIQSFLSFRSGKIFGAGLGNGNSKLFFLPEVHTDFIFALVGEELGFVGAVILLLVFAYLGYLFFKVVFRTPDPFGCYLAFGLGLSLLLQVAVNVGGVTGVIPVKGLPLPFISWGRSALLVNLAMVGILLNIARQSRMLPTHPSP